MQALPDGYQVTVEAAARALRPLERLSIADWAAKYRRLPRGKSVQRWDNDRMPFLRGVMAALEDEHPAPIVCYIKPSQTGGSEVAVNWIGRTIHQNPTSFLALFPGEKESGKWVRGKLNPMLRSTPQLRAILPPGRKRSKTDDDSTLKEKHYPGGVLYTGSGNIANDLAQITVQYGLIDDADRIPLTLEGEGDPGELLIMRTATHPLRKVFIVSSPTDEETSRVHQVWLTSTQDRWFVPCPRCGGFQVLSFDNLDWPEGKPQLAVYLCEHCEKAIEHAEKTELLAGGEWRATHPEREAICKGFASNGLMTPIGLGFTWAEHAAAWDRARGRPEKERVFFNTRRGEVAKSDKERVEWEDLKRRREPYQVRTVPPGYLVLTAGVDFQKDRLEAGIIAWARGMRIAVIDHVIQYGSPTRDELFDWLDDWIAKPIANSFGVPMRISAAMLDSGNWQQEVIGFTRTRKSRGIFAGKGSSVRSRQPIGKPSLVDVNYRGEAIKRGAEQYQLGVTVIKRWLYQRMAADAGTPDAPVLPADRHVRFPGGIVDTVTGELIGGLPDEWFRQLAAERYDPKAGFVKVYDRNEALDTVVNAIAAGQHHSVAVHRYRELDWQRLEQMYEPKAGAAKAEAPKAPATMSTFDGFPIVAAKVG